MKNIYGIKRSDLEEYFLSIGEKKFKQAKIIKNYGRFDKMTNIKKEIQDKLKTDFSMEMIKVAQVQHDTDAHKYLFLLKDHNYIEAVLMEHDYGLSVCVSSEVGCNIGWDYN